MIRLNKLLAERGIGARRKCDMLIAEGRVRVNGQRVSEAGTKVEEGRDRVEVDGRALPAKAAHRYYVLNKPVGVITTLQDPEGRRTIAQMLPPGGRLYPVGRLDADTSGLLMLTNDGELAHKLMHPRYGVVKVYRVRLNREPSPRQLDRLARGVEFEPGRVSAPARVRRITPEFEAIMIEVAIHEGRHRQVRRMCEAVGLEVTGLHRVAYGPVRLGPLARGMWRELSEAEVVRLRAVSARPVGRRAGGSGARRRMGHELAVKPASEAAPARRPAHRAPDRPAGEQRDLEERRWDARVADEGEAPVWPKRAGGVRGDADFHGPAPEQSAPRRESAPRRKPAVRPGRGSRPTSAARAEGLARGERPPRARRPARGPRPAAGSRKRREEFGPSPTRTRRTIGTDEARVRSGRPRASATPTRGRGPGKGQRPDPRGGGPRSGEARRSGGRPGGRGSAGTGRRGSVRSRRTNR